MQSIAILNAIDAARNRVGANTKLVNETREAHQFAVQKGLIANEKRLRQQLKRQETSLAIAQAELAELEKVGKEDGDLLTPTKNGRK